MLKKLLSLFGIGKEEETQAPSQERSSSVTNHSKENDSDDDDDDDDEEEKVKEVKKVIKKKDQEEDDDDDDDDDDNDDSDDNGYSDDDEDEWPEEEIGQQVAVELDPETLHGINYTVAEFDAEVEKRVQAHVADDKADGEDVRQEDIDNYYVNIRQEVYKEWTGANSNMIMQWEHKNQMKHIGIASFGDTQHDDNNPLLEPIHGVSLQDYAAISYYAASGSDFNAIVAQLGIDMAIYQEASALWSKRMQEDTSFTVTNLFSQYYNSADQHPSLTAVAVELSEKGKETVEKMIADRFFYEELCGARSAAFEYGLDGSQWIMDNYEVSLGEFQKVATYHTAEDQKHIDMQLIKRYSDYMSKKMEEYKKKFAEEQGGNVADDIEF